MSSRRIELSALSVKSADGQGGAQAVANIREMIVFVNFTAETSITRLDVYLQSSSDGGTTWFDIANRVNLTTLATGAHATASTSDRNIPNGGMSAAPEKAVGHYAEMPFGDLIRAAWIINGTDATFSVKAVVKT